MQRVGHRFARLLQARFGPEAITESVPVPDTPAVAAETEANAGRKRTPGRPVTRCGTALRAALAPPAGRLSRPCWPARHASFHRQAGPVPQDARRITWSTVGKTLGMTSL